MAYPVKMQRFQLKIFGLWMKYQLIRYICKNTKRTQGDSDAFWTVIEFDTSILFSFPPEKLSAIAYWLKREFLFQIFSDSEMTVHFFMSV